MLQAMKDTAPPMIEHLETAALDYGRYFDITLEDLREIAPMTVAEALSWPLIHATDGGWEPTE